MDHGWMIDWGEENSEYLQTTHCKCNGQSNLHAPICMEIPYNTHGKDQNDDIGDDIWDATPYKKCLLVDTRSFYSGVPICGKGSACCEVRDDGWDGQCYQRCHEDMNNQKNSFRGKQSFIECQNGKLWDVDAAKVYCRDGDKILAPCLY